MFQFIGTKFPQEKNSGQDFRSVFSAMNVTKPVVQVFDESSLEMHLFFEIKNKTN